MTVASSRQADAERRAEVVALAERVGAAEAGRQRGVKADTVRQWVRRQALHAEGAIAIAEANLGVEHVPAGAVEVVAPGERWARRRPAAADRLAELIDKAIVAVDAALDAGSSKAAKEHATTLAILIDKAQLVTGSATSRTQKDVRTLAISVEAKAPADLRAEIAGLRAELGLGGAG